MNHSNNRFKFSYLVLTILALTACLPATSPPATATRIEPTHDQISPTASATPTSTPAPFMIPTAQPSAGTPIEPLVTARAEHDKTWGHLEDWSPAGSWISYWVSSPEGGGTVHLTNLTTAQSCVLGKSPNLGFLNDRVDAVFDNGNMMSRSTGWLPDGRIVAIDSETGRAAVSTPCAGNPAETILEPLQGSLKWIVSISPDYAYWLLNTTEGYWLYDARTDTARPVASDVPVSERDPWGGAWSPGSTALAMSNFLGESTSVRTWVIDTATGTMIDHLDWQSMGMPGWHAEEPQPPPTWLDGNRLIWNHANGDSGPLLWTVGGDTISIAAYQLAIDCALLNCAQVSVPWAAPGPDGSYHLLIRVEDFPTGARDWFLYHSETSAIEDLETADYWPYTSQDGAAALLAADEFAGTWDMQFARLIDPPGSESQPAGVPRSRWSPGSPPVSVVLEGSAIRAYSIPDGQLLGEWWTGDYRVGTKCVGYPTDHWWSPDGNHLLVFGQKEGPQCSGDFGLFLIPIPDQP